MDQLLPVQDGLADFISLSKPPHHADRWKPADFKKKLWCRCLFYGAMLLEIEARDCKRNCVVRQSIETYDSQNYEFTTDMKQKTLTFINDKIYLFIYFYYFNLFSFW